MLCIICETPIGRKGDPLSYYGNNAQPIADGRCCDSCNQHEVIPARLEEMADFYEHQKTIEETTQ